MVNARSFVAALSVSLFCSAAQAQTGFYNWNQFAAWCRSTGGTPLPAPPRCIPHQSGPIPVTPQQQGTTFSQELTAYVDLVHRMNHGIPGFVNVFAWPTSSAELSGKLLELDNTLDSVIEFKERELDEAIYDRDHVQTIDGEIAAMKKEVDEIQNRNGWMHEYVRRAREETTVLNYYAAGQQWRAIEWLDYVRPQDFPRHYMDDPKIRSLTLPPIDIPPAQKYEEPSLFVARHTHYRSHAARALITSYSNMEKTSFINNGFDYLLSTKNKIDEVNREYDPKLFIDKETKLDELRRVRDKGIFDGQQWLKQVPAVHANFVVAAAEAFAWKTYTGHIAVPEAQKFYDLNKSWYQLGSINDQTVQNGLKAGKSALSVLSSGADDIKGFLDVEDQTLDFMKDTQRFMAEAPRIAAYGTPEETQSFLGGINDKLSGFNLTVMDDAKHSLGAFTPFGQALMGADVPVPYQGIAKRLGLGN